MTIQPPAPGEPRRPHGPRDPGDAWVVAPDGRKYWGRFGAAGLLAHDPARGILLQLRVEWSHHGGTWGLPGGALQQGESPVAAAVREAGEEAGVPAESVQVRATSVWELGFWRYTTVLAEVTEPFDPVISDHESLQLRWVELDDVGALPLHPGFAAAWPRLRQLLEVRPVVVVDAANTVGARPDGWWRDRKGAAERLLAHLNSLSETGVPAAFVGLAGTRWYPQWLVVLEGQAKGAARAPAPRVMVVDAPGEGDDEIVARARQLADSGRHLVVVSADRGLRARLPQEAVPLGPGRLWDLFDAQS